MKKRIRIGVVLSAIAVAGLAAMAAWAHIGSGTATCTAASFSFSDFNAGTNTVTEEVWVGGTKAISQPFTFTGSAGQNTIALQVQGDTTVQPRASWNTNGQTGSFTGDVTQISCHTVTVTTTVPSVTVTTSTLPVGVTNINTVTNTNTVTVTGPAPAAPTVTVTSPAPPAQTVTVTKTTPGRTIVKTKVKVRKVKAKCKRNAFTPPAIVLHPGKVGFKGNG
jgi:hypothetical protein